MKERIRIINTEGKARRGEIHTPHGVVQTPAFMNVATCGAIKGAVSALDLKDLKCQVQLCNTYHLHLRPGDEIVKLLGGLHKFTNWQGPILTDSGGFQVFSLAKLRNIKEEGVTFASHIDGRKIFMGPEESMRIQSHLGSTIAMAFDECIENPAAYEYVKQSCARTLRWLYRCKEELERLNAKADTINREQWLWGINQGSTYEDLRKQHMCDIRELDLDGYAIGGLAVGETAEEMYRIIEAVEPEMPACKPRYLMGVGTPANILEAVSRGIDIFDCVMPTRNARHGSTPPGGRLAKRWRTPGGRWPRRFMPRPGKFTSPPGAVKVTTGPSAALQQRRAKSTSLPPPSSITQCCTAAARWNGTAFASPICRWTKTVWFPRPTFAGR